MQHKNTLKPLAVAMGAALVAGAATLSAAQAAENPFAMTKLNGGYMVAEEKAAEGKCGEGKCGANKKDMPAEGKCGGGAKTDAEGKCGGAEKAKAEGKCGGATEKKTTEGKCGGAK